MGRGAWFRSSFQRGTACSWRSCCAAACNRCARYCAPWPSAAPPSTLFGSPCWPRWILRMSWSLCASSVTLYPGTLRSTSSLVRRPWPKCWTPSSKKIAKQADLVRLPPVFSSSEIFCPLPDTDFRFCTLATATQAWSGIGFNALMNIAIGPQRAVQ